MDGTWVTVFEYKGEVVVASRWAQPLTKQVKAAKNVTWTSRFMFINFVRDLHPVTRPLKPVTLRWLYSSRVSCPEQAPRKNVEESGQKGEGEKCE
jgi:hypothetical protein